jgi:hypothetical protein
MVVFLNKKYPFADNILFRKLVLERGNIMGNGLLEYGAFIKKVTT